MLAWPLSHIIARLFIMVMFQISFDNRLFTATQETSVDDTQIIFPEVLPDSNRRRRQTTNQHETEDLRIRFEAFGEPFHARLKLNNNLLTRNTVAQVIGDRGRVLHEQDVTNCYYTGKLVDDPTTVVSLANCDGLEGTIETLKARYFLQPLRNRTSHSGIALPHTISRQIHKQRNSTSVGTHDDIHAASISAKETATRLRRRRSVLSKKAGEQTIETLLVIDQKMTQYYGLDAAKQYALTVFNIAHDILRDPTIGPTSINLVIVKILVLVAAQEGLTINHHARNTLIAFGKWAGLQSSADSQNGGSFDYAVLLTRYNICKDKEEPCDVSGVSHIGGMCRFPSSASVIQDHGLMSGFSLAHHTGHNLGMEHDGIGNSCKGRNNIMNLHSGYGEGAYIWSVCSALRLQNFLKTVQSNCLNDVPSKEKRTNVNVYRNAGTIYDLASQCKLVAGDGAKGCYFGDPMEACVELQCFLPNITSCVRTGKPPIDGTMCGDDKWCKHGQCVAKHNPDPTYVDGGWSSWGEYNQCTRPCGGGITFRERKCQNPSFACSVWKVMFCDKSLNPGAEFRIDHQNFTTEVWERPMHGGKFCDGESRQYDICNQRPCVDLTTNFRKLQCKKHSGKFLGDKKYDWTYNGTSGMPTESSCDLKCTAKGNPKVSNIFGHAMDGTECYLYNLNLPGRCIAGECISVGCDLVLESKEKVDRCGVCKGDGTSCKNKFEAISRSPAIFVNVTDRKPSKLKLNATKSDNVTRDEFGEKISNRNFTVVGNKTKSVTTNKTENAAGVDHLFNALHKLKILRNLMKAILNKKCKSDEKCMARYKYFDLKHKKSEITRPKVFEWTTISTGCSVTCGIGTEALYPECRRLDDGSPVGRKFCSMQPEPVERSKACRMPSCKTRWITGQWESCSKSCDAGIQSRDVYCAQTIKDNFIVPDALCHAPLKPASTQICNKQKCPAKWVTEPFGKCSTSCGQGIQLREVFCKVNAPTRGLIIVDDSNCNAVERPEKELICNVHNPCPGDGNCGGNFTELTGILFSPGYPKIYPNNKECVSEITATTGQVLMLEFIELKTNGSRRSDFSCEGDFIRITDSGCENRLDKPSSTYCGKEIPKDIFFSSSNKVCVKFVSDESEVSKGFALRYTAIEKPKNQAKVVDICDVHGKMLKTSYGAITSPNYPDTYPMNEYCKVTVSSPDKSGLVISFKGFHVGSMGTNKSCDNDFLQLDHDGTSEKFCGQQKAKTATIKEDKFTATFASRNIKMGGTGFVLTFITRKFMRSQIDYIKQKQQVLGLRKGVFGRVLKVPTVSDATIGHLQPVKEQPKLLVEALTSLKKNTINHPLNNNPSSKKTNDSFTVNNSTHLSLSSKPAKKLSDEATLKSVLELLGGDETKPAPEKASSERDIIQPKANSTKVTAPFEDYTKAGIYKKTGVPVSVSKTVKTMNKDALSTIHASNVIGIKSTDGQLEHQFGAISQQQQGAQVSNGPHKQGMSFVSSNSNNMPQAKPMTSKELWQTYWKKYKEIYDTRRNNIPLYPGLQTSSVLTYHTSKYWPMPSMSYVWTRSMNTNDRAVSKKACPPYKSLQCPTAVRLQRCQMELPCTYGLQCCPTACPYTPFTCTWT